MTAIYSDLGMSVKMRLYSMQKHHLLILFVLFFLSFFICLNIGVFGPKILKTISTKTNYSANIKTGPFLLQTPYLGKFHQQLWITSQPEITGRKEEFSKDFVLNIHLYSQDHSEYFNRTRTLHCINEKCDVFNILHLDYLHNEHYFIELKLLNLQDSSNIDIKSFIFTFNSYNPSFTKLELWYRFVFLIITFVILILYTSSLKKFSLRDWSIEQKWVFILLRSLLFFNNPIFPLIVLVDSWIPHILDAMFQSTFFALIMVFWLSIYHGFRHNDRNFCTFYIPKFLIVFSIWLLSLFLLLWQQYRSNNDPTYNLSLDENYYFIFRSLFLIFFILYLLYLLYLIVRSIAELKSMPYFDIRIKFSIFLMIVLMTTLIIIASMRVKSEPFKQSLFENFTKNYRNTAEFCCLFSIFNLYIYTLAFVYSPAKNASTDSDYADNPTFAMLNDTDEEDVVYGMESISKPLDN